MLASSGSYSLSYLFGVFLIVVIGRLFQTVTYNLYRHPLAHIPGPKLAATTYLYQTYFSLVGGSRFYKQIAELHKKYGENTSREELAYEGILLMVSSLKKGRSSELRPTKSI
jgi:hypothetical protein